MWNEYLEHSWGPWKNHKYVKKEGTRYYYDAKTGATHDKAGLVTNQVVNANKKFREIDQREQFKQHMQKQTGSITDQNKAFREANVVKYEKKTGLVEKAKIASTAISNLSNNVVNAGKKFVKNIFSSSVTYTDKAGNTVKVDTKKDKKK